MLPAGQSLDWLDVTTHHEHGALDRLDEEVLLLAGGVVGPWMRILGPDLTVPEKIRPKCVETTLVRGGHHLET